MRLLKRRKKSLCDRCDNLISKCCGEYKCMNYHKGYYRFRMAPTYCMYFKEREVDHESL